MRVKKFVKMRIKGSDGRQKNTDYSVREDGVLLNTYGNENSPIFVGQDFIDAKLPMPQPDLDWTEYSEEEQSLALTINHPRVALMPESREMIDRWLSGEEDREKERIARLDDKNNQNAFLTSKGYRWEKKRLYIGGEIGDIVEDWILLDPSGAAVIDFQDGGGWVKQIGDLKHILTKLGYYGQEAIDKAESEAAARATRREMRTKVDAYFNNETNRTGETYEDAQSLFTARPVQIEKHYPRRRFRIENDCIWLEAHNRSDGDDWSLNNCDYGIATQFKYDQEIADCLRKLAS